MTTTETATTTEVGSYFISNYPPFSQWKTDFVPTAIAALNSDPEQTKKTPLGLYIHIPFCRKRCKFCYFRVYTNQNAKAIEDYVQALMQEIRAAIAEGRFEALRERLAAAWAPTRSGPREAAG